MIDTGLAELSDQLFWIALATYSVGALLLFAHLAYRSRTVGNIGTVVAWGGAIAHASSVVARGLAAGRVPWGNMYEYSSLLGLLLVLAYLILIDLRAGLRQLGGFALGAAILSLASARMVYVPARELVPALNSIWLKFHVFAAISGSTLFGVSFIFTALFLVKRRLERRPFVGSTVGAAHITTFEDPPNTAGDTPSITDPSAVSPTPGPTRRGRLPSSETLDRYAFRTITFAFPIWTFAVLAGAVWAHEAWGRYWGWDPKETWAFITWVVYAAYLHARATAGWREVRAAIVSTIGFACVVFTYFAVNLWISGLHSYAK